LLKLPYSNPYCAVNGFSCLLIALNKKAPAEYAGAFDEEYTFYCKRINLRTFWPVPVKVGPFDIFGLLSVTKPLA